MTFTGIAMATHGEARSDATALVGRALTFDIDGTRLLDDVSVTFGVGRLSLVIGANGAGKSTLIRALCGQLGRMAGGRRGGGTLRGDVRYAGRPIAEWSALQLAQVRAVLSQSVELAFPLRAWEVVMMGRYPHFSGRPEPRDERACEEAMRFFDVWEWADRTYLTLSGGERQRVHFARVLAQVWYPVAGAHRYLVLDEPLTFLDIRYQYEFMRKVRELMAAGDMVVVGVVHDLNLAARFAGQVVLMKQGRVLAAGTPREVLTAPLVDAAFGIRPKVHPGEDGGVHLVFD